MFKRRLKPICYFGLYITYTNMYIGTYDFGFYVVWMYENQVKKTLRKSQIGMDAEESADAIG